MQRLPSAGVSAAMSMQCSGVRDYVKIGYMASEAFSPCDMLCLIKKQVELNRLTKEISLLEEELKTLEGLPPASKCCTEVVEFVGKHSDPFLPFVNKGQSISSWDRWFKEHSTDSECSCCCSCRSYTQPSGSHLSSVVGSSHILDMLNESILL
ncbi:hypothetical protein SUGI_0132200 [Cryptomeria japonica]|nr:hypothetical protein SUGI_0132200 [Cryptomeria japonica]